MTKHDIPDPQNLNLSLKLNGNTVQSSNTSDMIFTVRQIIAYLTRFLELRVGDIIATGTPEGVGIGMKPPVFLKVGDIMEVEIEHLGIQKQEVAAFT